MKNIKITTSLLIVLGLIIIFVLYLSSYTYITAKNVRHTVKTLYFDRIKPLEQLYRVSNSYVGIVDCPQKLLLNEIAWNEGRNIIITSIEEIDNNWNIYSKTSLTEEEEVLMNEVGDLKTKANLISEKLLILIENKDREGLMNMRLTGEISSCIVPLKEKLDELINMQIIVSREIYNNIENNYIRTNFSFFLIVILGILFCVAFFLIIIYSIRQKIKNATEAIFNLSEGDYTTGIEGISRNEIGILLGYLETMTVKQKEVIQTVKSASEGVAAAGTELSSASQELSLSASEQASSLEEVSSSMEEMASSIEQNAGNAKQTEEIANMAADNIEECNSKVSETAESMNTIADKISIIGDIAFQTNILALNAAVEAARAGEHGKGFGVVAAEVGKLAERSKVAAAEINELSGTGVKNAEDSKKLLSELVPEIRKTASLVQEITAASQEQNSGSDQINTTIQQLNEITQQNAASSEEMATSSEELASQADQLLESVSFFNVGENSGTKQPYKALMSKKKKAKKENWQKEKPKGVNIKLNEKGDTLDDQYERF